MNNLSAFIYFMGVVDGASNLFTLLAVASTITAVLLFIWYLVIGFNPDEDEVQASRPFFKRVCRIWVFVALIGWCGFVFLPTRQTLLLIAGSEVSDRVINSKAVSDVVNPGIELIKTWIKAETERLAKH